MFGLSNTVPIDAITVAVSSTLENIGNQEYIVLLGGHRDPAV